MPINSKLAVLGASRWCPGTWLKKGLGGVRGRAEHPTLSPLEKPLGWLPSPRGPCSLRVETSRLRCRHKARQEQLRPPTAAWVFVGCSKERGAALQRGTSLRGCALGFGDGVSFVERLVSRQATHHLGSPSSCPGRGQTHTSPGTQHTTRQVLLGQQRLPFKPLKSSSPGPER